MEPKKLSELTPSNLQTLLPEKSEWGNEISIYKGELTDRCLVNSVAMIKKSFPALPIGFYDIFIDRLKANGFTDSRLKDAVSHVIDNCQYPTPTIANFISFDRKIKLYTYQQYCKLCDEGFGKLYKPVLLPKRTKPVWVNINDMEISGLTEYKPDINQII